MERMNEREYKSLKLSDSAKNTLLVIADAVLIKNVICDYYQLKRGGGQQGSLKKLIDTGLVGVKYLDSKLVNMLECDVPENKKAVWAKYWYMTKNWYITEKGKTALRIMTPAFSEVK